MVYFFNLWIFTWIFKRQKKGFLYIFFLTSFFLFSIVLTGERSNTIKVFFGVVLFISILDFIRPKTKMLILAILVSSIFLLVSNSDYLKNRYVGQFYYYFSEKIQKSKVVVIINYIDQVLMFLKTHQF